MEREATDPVPSPSVLGGRYQLGDRLGRGAIGEVRAARDLRLQREVAVKLLHPEVAAQPSARDRFEAEARAAASVVHPHVVAVFDRGQQVGIPFLVMERLSGRTLADAIDEGPMDPGTVRRLGVQVLDGLAAAHEAGLIHRDIKPANVLSAGPGTWKVGDFGIAKSVEIGSDLTATGLVVGTPAYLAPERMAGGPATAASDLYAVGVVLYEALIGRRAKGRAPGAICWQPLPPLTLVRADVPKDLAAVITAALDTDPTQRFPSASAMASALVATPSVDDVPTSAIAAAISAPPPRTEVMTSLPHLAAGPQLAAGPHLAAGPQLVAGRLRSGRLLGRLAIHSARPAGRHPVRGPVRPLAQRRGLLAALSVAAVLILSAIVFTLGGHSGHPSPVRSPVPEAVTATTTTTIASPPVTAAPVTAVVASHGGAPSGKGHHKHGG